MALLLFSAVTHAVTLYAGMLPDEAADKPESYFEVRNFLKPSADPAGQLPWTINFDEANPKHKANRLFVGVLNRSIELTPTVRSEIAQEIAVYSDVCDLDQLGLTLYMAPISGLSPRQFGVTDNRRIVNFVVTDCLDEMPGACLFMSTVDSGPRFMSMLSQKDALITQLRRCHTALQYTHEKWPERFVQFKAAHHSATRK